MAEELVLLITNIRFSQINRQL